jgi:hypothetical protein
LRSCFDLVESKATNRLREKQARLDLRSIFNSGRNAVVNQAKQVGRQVKPAAQQAVAIGKSVGKTVWDPDRAAFNGHRYSRNVFDKMQNRYAPFTRNSQNKEYLGFVEFLRDRMRLRGYRYPWVNAGAKSHGGEDTFSIMNRRSPNLHTSDLRQPFYQNSSIGLTRESPAAAAHEMAGHPFVYTEQWGRYVPKSVKNSWSNRVSPLIPESIKKWSPHYKSTSVAPVLDRTKSTENLFNTMTNPFSGKPLLNNERVKSFVAPSPVRRGLKLKPGPTPNESSFSYGEAKDYVASDWTRRDWWNNITGRAGTIGQSILPGVSTAITGNPLWGTAISQLPTLKNNIPTLYHEAASSIRGQTP